MSPSILLTTKHALGLEDDYTHFDPDIIMHINSALADLNQLGVGPSAGFEITDATAAWDNFLSGEKRLNAVKTYVYLRVRMLFDPPATGYLISAYEKELTKLEWRLNVEAESPTVTTVYDGGSPEEPTVIVYDGGAP